MPNRLRCMRRLEHINDSAYVFGVVGYVFCLCLCVPVLGRRHLCQGFKVFGLCFLAQA